MCGIAGYCNYSSAPRGDLKRALQALHHRGPDDSGMAFFPFMSHGETGLGSTRLSIMDLSTAGRMPMSTADGNCSLIFNGEIYDAPVHRRLLERRGVQFKSRTDTEVLLYGLALDGPEFLDGIDGMYAFAFWDQREPAGLLLARDRYGEKPLFITENGDSLLFASELPALLLLMGSPPSCIDLEVLRHVVDWGYAPAERSIFKQVRKLREGSWEWHGQRKGTGQLRALDSSAAIRECPNLKTAGGMVRSALEESVAARLIADVPTGVFLSGGLDSAGIAAIAASLLGKSGSKQEPLNTYTVGYAHRHARGEHPCSELLPARAIAERLGTRHHEITLTSESLQSLPYIASALGEPIGDPASLPTFFLSAFASRTSTVLLTGEGADEVFYGYPRYLRHDAADWLGQQDACQKDRRWKGLPEAHADLWCAPDLTLTVAYGDSRRSSSAETSRADDLVRWLPSNVLTRVDRMTMAASIESRAPFLAREVVRLGLGLPARLQRRFPYGKLALRQALRPYLPFWKRWGRKQPFAVPLSTWLTGPLRGLFDDVFFGDRLAARGWFQRSALRAVGASVLQGDRRNARLAWTILTLELWARAHVDGERPSRPELQSADVKVHRQNLVVSLDFPPVTGGIQSYTQELWGRGGFGELTVIAPKTAGSEAHDRAFPAKIMRLSAGSGYAGRVAYLGAMALRLPRLLRRGPVLHVAHTALSPAIVPFCHFLRTPVVVWTYALELTNPRFARPTRALLNRADRVVVISEYTRALAVTHGANPASVVKISPGGDDLRLRFPETRGERFRAELEIHAGEFVILSVGRLSPFNRYKGFDRVIEVASLLVQRGRQFKWVVAGSGSDLAMYQAAVQAAELSEHVFFAGRLEDASLADAYASCDLFCLLSREEASAAGTFAEGYGIVFVQAGSFGKPVLGLDRGGVAAAVRQGETGVLLAVDQASPIADNIEWLIDHPEERQRMGSNGERHALGEGSWSQSRERLRQMLESL